ncbi:MAG: dTDP-4-dehydrorhamnose reductase [Candidatus Omnitrophota bacterium]|nr:MAG: dTDP-4-dehydrorhamnose reductase [Candidatus Omnitrophota bacterium]
MKKILITGGKGLVGRNAGEILSDDFEVFSFGKDELDITDRENVIKIFNEIKPDIVLHSGALTDVDLCEENPEKAYLVNSFGTQNVSVASQNIKAYLIYLSTDFIFDGKKNSPYSEYDIPNPLSIYGKSKLLGEYFVSHLSDKFLIIRTSRIFGKGGRNFASKIPFLMKEKEKIFLTEDIINSPTYVVDLVNTIKFLIKKEVFGILNFSNKGFCSWFDYGKKIKEFLGLETEIIPVKFKDFKEKKAQRPPFSALNTELIESLGFKIPDWEYSLKVFLEEIWK